MHPASLENLRELGRQLDANVYPRVLNDGIVALSDPGVGVLSLSAEKCNERQRENRPAAGSRQGPAGRQRPANRSRSPRTAAPFVSERLRQEYLGQLDAVMAAYPRTTVWKRREGLWLFVESSVLAELDRRATFLVALPFVENALPKAWGFWATPLSWSWIGPRHTNFGCGSICAFEPSDQVWLPGESIVSLLDFYTLWALRHLHLEIERRWPGQQWVPFAFERIEELDDDDFCGCSEPKGRYAQCCKQADLAADKNTIALEFLQATKFQTRQAPERIIKFLNERDNPPGFLDDLI